MNILVLGVVIALILSVGTFVVMFTQTQINTLQVEINKGQWEINKGLIENDRNDAEKWKLQVEVNELLIKMIIESGK